MNGRIKTAFTLVELLVVIAIIGILSGLIIVGMNNSVQQASFARGQVFSASLRDSLLGNLISEWKFDEGSGTSTVDSWGGSNNCTFADDGGACSASLCPQWVSTDCVYNKCLSFDGSGPYLNCGSGTNLHQSGNFAVEAWVKLAATPSHSSDSMIIGDYNGHYYGYKFSIGSNLKVYFLVGRLSDTSSASSSSNETLSLNKWYHVAVSYDGKLNTFVNGSKTIGSTYGPIEKEVASTFIGRAQWWAQYFNGTIDNIRFYNTSVSISQMREHYYSGTNRLLSKIRINREEYKEFLLEISSSLAKI